MTRPGTGAAHLLSGATGRERVVLGGRFGEETVENSYRRLDIFRDLGGRAVETAHCYAGGRAEEVIGQWIRSRRCREHVMIVDKVCHPTADGISAVKPEILRRQLAISLRRLRTDCLDVLLLHRDDPSVPVEDLVQTFADEIAVGRLRAFGVANWPMTRLDQFIGLASKTGHPVLASYQYSLAMPHARSGRVPCTPTPPSWELCGGGRHRCSPGRHKPEDGSRPSDA